MNLAEQMINTLMQKLDCDEETAKDIIETDKRIDKGEKLFDLPPELEKGAKKARSAGNCNGYTKANREKKVDEDKKFLMEKITDELSNYAEHFTIINAEREMLLTYNGKKYKVVLSCPRS